MNPDTIYAELLKMKPIAWQLSTDKSHAEDLLSDAILVVIESKKTFKTIDDATRYCYFIMSNMVHQERSDYNKKYIEFKSVSRPIEDYDVVEADGLPEGKLEYVNENLVNAALETLYWYDREILKLYAEHGSFRNVEHKTGIPYSSIYLTCKKAQKQIKQFLNLTPEEHDCVKPHPESEDPLKEIRELYAID